MGDLLHSDGAASPPVEPASDPEGASPSLPGSGPSAEAAGDAAVSLEPVSAKLAPPHGPLSASQADAVARMVVQGRPLSLIAMAVGRSPEALRRLVHGSLRPKIDEVRALVIRETSAHWFEMLAMLPQARANMQSALLSADEQTRVSMSKWLHERIVPAPVQQQEIEHTVHLGEDVAQLLGAMNARLEEIQTANEGRDPLARVRTGPEALRRTVTIVPTAAEDDSSPAA